ncbi:MAG: DUF4091 domain-containing protein [Bacteroidales bacterium]|nr:DUF4091 domain-containing protein [Bacteroidales bacterium]
MKKFYVCAALLCIAFAGASAQNFTPVEELPEAQFPFTPDPAWAAVKAPAFGWGTLDERYDKYRVPVLNLNRVPREQAWRGERVSFQAVVFTPIEIHDAAICASDLVSGKNTISVSNIQWGFERYVVGDCYGPGGDKGYFPAENGGMDFSRRDSVLVPDAITGPKMQQIEARTSRPAWFTIWVPQDARPGKYQGTVSFSCKELSKPLELKYTVVVKDRVLPKPSQWQFHLDIWQNPYSIARYFGVRPWSDRHFELMRPFMTKLAQAGEKVVTATLMWDCWGPQTLDLFETMVQVTRNIDGTMVYNYDIFDRWVEFMASCGITEQINCFTIAPWRTRFRYFDRATDSQQVVDFDYGDEAYRSIWIPVLKDFAEHLRVKGWFDKTRLAVDERGVEVMQKVIAVAREADPGFKFALAGNYHPEVESDLVDYSLDLFGDGTYLKDTDGPAISDRRRGEGKFTTFYICCGEGHPNTFTFSPLAESASLGWYALCNNYDGMLRWAYNSWNAEPMVDTRWYNLSSGDNFMIYPQGWSSVRWERFVEGIQDFEKVLILREEYAKQPRKLQKLEEAISQFTHDRLWGGNVEPLMQKAQMILDTF